MEEKMSRLVAHFKNLMTYEDMYMEIRNEIKEVEYQLQGLHSPTWDKVGGTTSFTQDDTKRLSLFEKKERLVKERKIVSAYTNAIGHIMDDRDISDDVQMYLTQRYLFGDSVTDSLRHVSKKNENTARKIIKQELDKISLEEIDELDELLKNAKQIQR